jgi:hypothetical protein
MFVKIFLEGVRDNLHLLTSGRKRLREDSNTEDQLPTSKPRPCVAPQLPALEPQHPADLVPPGFTSFAVRQPAGSLAQPVSLASRLNLNEPGVLGGNQNPAWLGLRSQPQRPLLLQQPQHPLQQQQQPTPSVNPLPSLVHAHNRQPVARQLEPSFRTPLVTAQLPPALPVQVFHN